MLCICSIIKNVYSIYSLLLKWISKKNYIQNVLILSTLFLWPCQVVCLIILIHYPINPAPVSLSLLLTSWLSSYFIIIIILFVLHYYHQFHHYHNSMSSSLPLLYLNIIIINIIIITTIIITFYYHHHVSPSCFTITNILLFLLLSL